MNIFSFYLKNIRKCLHDFSVINVKRKTNIQLVYLNSLLIKLHIFGIFVLIKKEFQVFY